MADNPRPRGRRKLPALIPSSNISTEVVKILGKRLFGRKDLMPGVLVRVGEGITAEEAKWAIENGVACWNGDFEAEIEAQAKRQQQANKVAAEILMGRFDELPPEERAYLRDYDPGEGEDV